MHIESKLIRGKHLLNLKIVYIPIKTIQLEVFFNVRNTIVGFVNILCSLVSNLVPDKRNQLSFQFIHATDHGAWSVDQHHHLRNK